MTFLVVFCGEMAVLLMALGKVDDENVNKSKKKETLRSLHICML